MKARKYRRSEHYMHSVYEKFGHRSPYQLLVDDTFCRASLQHKFDLRERLPVILGAPVRALVTNCTMTALREASRNSEEPSVSGAPFVARRLELRRCRHDEALPVWKCIAELVGKDNQHHYGIATDDEKLKERMRRVAGVPLIYLERTFPLLEAPSHTTLKELKKREEAKLHVSKKEAEIIRRDFGEASEPEIKSKHKRKKIKGPNPLSTKKSTKAIIVPVADGTKRKRKRRAKKQECEQ